MPVRIVTVSRLFAAGGTRLATAVGDRLGWRVIDRQLVARAAERLRARPDEVEAIDERGETPWERAARYVADAFPEMLMPPLPTATPTRLALARVIETLVDEMVAEAPAVLVGHGGQCIFHDRPDAVHVRAWAPLDQRTAEASRRLGLPPSAARHEVHRHDEERRDYIQQIYRVDWADPALYDLQVNTARVTVDEAADMVAGLVGARA